MCPHLRWHPLKLGKSPISSGIGIGQGIDIGIGIGINIGIGIVISVSIGKCASIW